MLHDEQGSCRCPLRLLCHHLIEGEVRLAVAPLLPAGAVANDRKSAPSGGTNRALSGTKGHSSVLDLGPARAGPFFAHGASGMNQLPLIVRFGAFLPEGTWP